MNPTETLTPEFLSHGEWENVQRMRKTRLLFRLCLLVIAIVLASASYLAYAVYRRFETRSGLLVAITRLHDYEIDIRILEPDGKLVPWRKEIHIGNDLQVDLWGGKVVLTKHGSAFSTDDSTARLTAKYAAWDGARNFMDRASDAVETVSPWRLFDKQRWFRLMKQTNGQRAWKFPALDGEWTIVEDGLGAVRKLTFTSGKFSLGSDTEVARVTTSNLRFEPYGIYPLLHAKSNLPTVPVPGGSPIQILAADINARGDAFFCFTGGSLRAVRNIFRAKQDRSYAITVLPAQLGTTKVTEAEFPTDDEIPPVWPTTLHVLLTSRTQKDIDFFYTFSGPTCELLPYYNVPVGGDKTFILALREFSAGRADFLDDVQWIDGQPRRVRTDPEIHAFALNINDQDEIHPEDREAAVKQSFLILLCDHTLDNPNNPAPFQVLQRDWTDCIARENKIHLDDEARKAQRAQDNLKSVP